MIEKISESSGSRNLSRDKFLLAKSQHVYIHVWFVSSLHKCNVYKSSKSWLRNRPKKHTYINWCIFPRLHLSSNWFTLKWLKLNYMFRFALVGIIWICRISMSLNCFLICVRLANIGLSDTNSMFERACVCVCASVCSERVRGVYIMLQFCQIICCSVAHFMLYLMIRVDLLYSSVYSLFGWLKCKSIRNKFNEYTIW